MEETQMYGSAAPSIYLLYLANMYFLKDKWKQWFCWRSFLLVSALQSRQ